jgi:zinc transport system ATP-binding protein
MSEVVLEVAELIVERSGVRLLDGVSFEIPGGTITAVVGPNGAGKSTLLSAILGLVPFLGAVRCHFRGAGRIGYVPQDFDADLHLPLTVAEFLALTRQRRPVCFGIEPAIQTGITERLAAVGLSGHERRTLAQLSGGERQRVLLARAIDPLPELLLLDEPATGLDRQALEILDRALLGLKEQGTAVLLVSHDPAQVERLADRALLLDKKILRQGPPGEVLEARWTPSTTA